MNLYLSLLFVCCIFAGSMGESDDQTKLNDGKLADGRLYWPRPTRGTLPYVQSDQAVPKKKTPKVNRKKFLKNLLKSEKKLKRTLKDIAKQRLHVQKLIQQEQQKLVDLQTKQRRVIKTTPKLKRLEARDRKLIARENSLRGEIQVVQKKYCSDCDTTTKPTDAVETNTSTSPAVTTPFFLLMKSVFPEPTKPPTPMITENTRRTRYPSNKFRRPNGKVKGHTTRTITEGVPSTLLTSSANVPIPTKPSTLTTTEPLLTYSAKTLPLTTMAPLSKPLPLTTMIPAKALLSTSKSSSNTVMPFQTTLGTRPTTSSNLLVVTTYLEPTSTLRTTMLRKFKYSTTVPWKYTVNPTQTKIDMPVDVSEHSTYAMTEDLSTSATMATTALTTKQFLTTKPDHRKYYTTINPFSRSKATRTSPTPVPVFTTKRMVDSRIESTPEATLKQALFTPTTGSSITDSLAVKDGNIISNTKGQSVSSVVDPHSESEKEAVVMYVSAAVSFVGVLIIIISVTVYITVFRGRCGKKKDEESSKDSKFQEE